MSNTDETLNQFFSHYLPKTHLCSCSYIYHFPLWCWTSTQTSLHLIYLVGFTAPRMTWLTYYWTCGDVSHPSCIGRFSLQGFHHQPPPLLSPGFRLWEPSYHCLPGLGFGCRARVILGSLTWDAQSLIRFFFHRRWPWRIQLVRPPCSSPILVWLGTISVNNVYV